VRCGGALGEGALADICPACAWSELGGAGGEMPRDEALPQPPSPGALFTLPGHDVLAEIARGGAGIVYRARQREPQREVALKMLLPQQSGSAEVRARFRLEAATIATLDHPAILPVYATGEHEGLPWFTMKLATGGTLADARDALRGRWREIAELVASLADGVHYAHSRGVLHRDIKPGNVLFDNARRAYVSDFGLAKFLAARGDLTREVSVMGTPAYMAPEVAAGDSASAAVTADVYGLGAMLYELLAGRPPFSGKSLSALFKEVAERTPDPPSRCVTGVPRDLEVIALHCLEKDPAKRYASAAALAEDLRLWLAGRTIRARPTGTFGRIARWSKRNPALASLAAALVVTLVVAALTLFKANRNLRASLAESLVAQARVVRQSGRQGQRLEAIDLLRRAAKIDPSAAARDEAIAALALPDWTPVEKLQLWDRCTWTVTPSPDFTTYLIEDIASRFSMRRRPDAEEIWTWPATEASEASATQPIFSRDGRWVAIHNQADEVDVLDVGTGQPVVHLTGRTYAFKGQVWSYGQDIDFAPDGSAMAVTRPEGGVSFVRLPDGAEMGRWEAKQWVTTLQFSPDGTQLAVGGGRQIEDSVLAVIDVRDGHAIAQEIAPQRIEFVEWSADGSRIATRAMGRNVEVRDARNLRVCATVSDRACLHGHFLPDPNRLILTEQIGSTRLWELDTGNVLVTKPDDGLPANNYANNPVRQWRSFSRGPALLDTFLESPVFRRYPPATPKYTVPERGWPADVSPDGKLLAIGGRGGGSIIDLVGGAGRATVGDGSSKIAGSIRFDPSGDAIWVCLIDGGLFRHVIERPKVNELAIGPGEKLDDENGFVFAASNTSTGRMALVNPEYGLVKIVDTRARRVMATWSHPGAWTAEFSPDGSRLLVNGNSIGHGAPVAVHLADTGVVMRTLGSNAGRMARWSPDGKWVIAGEGQEQCRLWRADDWSNGPPLPTNSPSPNDCVAFSPNGRELAYQSAAGIKLIETATGRELAFLTPQTGPGVVVDIRFFGNQCIAILYLDGSVVTWNLAALHRELSAIGLDWIER
jgi:WD40 repeat protein/tRNA A-37 threonylcarbamoyl transferase component Bud32